jgi:dihydropteroate synthase
MQTTKIRQLQCGPYTLKLGEKTLVMGILNVTPDSFSDGGCFNTVDKAVEQAKRLVAEGADLLDIGGESTRPGAEPVPLDEELQRVIPVIEALRGEVSVPISIDTYKAEVARQALQAGAHIINDVWGFQQDPTIAQVAAYYDCPVFLMHNRRDRNYTDLVADVKTDLLASVAIAKRACIREEQIILDPGFGFAKDYLNNLELMGRLSELTELGYPLLVGTSRKMFIRNTLDLPADDVVEGTAATVTLSIAQGCDIVRVHDVGSIVRTVKMTDAIVRHNRKS